MKKEKLLAIRDFIVKNCKIIFPVVVIVVVAITVAVAMGARKDKAEAESLALESSASQPESVPDTAQTQEVPLVPNENGELFTLIATYYNAVAQGDVETIRSVCSETTDTQLLRIQEKAKYLEYYPVLDIYTKPGYGEGEMIAYVYYKMVFEKYEEEIPGFVAWYICTDEQGQLYINTGERPEEVEAYISAVSTQDDVVEVNNRVNVEYNEVVTANPELLTYMQELSTSVDTAVGIALAKQNSSEEQSGESQTPQEESSAQSQPQEESAAASGPQYATATTTVNVRSSDSEEADKLGKVSGGTKVQVQEVRVNGWTKIVYEGKDGYIKSEYLQMAESVSGQEVIGTVTATININVRMAGSESAERLGMLAGGESLELLANENGWCKVNYNGQIGYVKADYVTQQ